MPTTDFTAAGAQVAARFTQLLTMGHVERMLAAQSGDEAIRVLNDLEWASALGESDQREQFERVIEDGLFDAKQALTSYLSVPELAEYLFLPYDLQNAKASLFAFRAGEKYEDIRSRLSPLGMLPRRFAYSVLEDPSKGREYSAGFLVSALQEARHMLDKNPEAPQIVEHFLDTIVYHRMQTAVAALESAPLQQFFDLQVLAENCKRLVRRSETEQEFFLEPKTILPATRSALTGAEITAAARGTVLEGHLQEGKHLHEEGKPLAEWELRLDLAVLHTLYWPARANPFGPENLAVYFFTKARNAEIIRTIVVGKQNLLPADTLREMIAPYFQYLRRS